MKVVLIDADSLLYKVVTGKFNQFENREKIPYDTREYYKHLDSWIKDIIVKSEATHYHMFLTIGKVFRHSVNEGYKKGRPERKPFFYYDLRNYLEDKWTFDYVNLLEAEDLCSVYAHHYDSQKINYCISRIDHDLEQIHGQHYNYSTDQIINISLGDSYYNFWKSMITGCNTDKVQGIPGMGDKKAEAYFKAVLTEENIKDPKILEKCVLQAYIEKFHTFLGIQKFQENYRLLYLLTKPEEVEIITKINFEFKQPIFYEQGTPTIKIGNFGTAIDELPDFLK